MGSFKLEKFKFLVYLIAPMIAVAVYSRPTVHETSLNYHRYVVYPAPEKKLVMRQPAPPPGEGPVRAQPAVVLCLK